MIAAFGICDEPEPGIITAPRYGSSHHAPTMFQN
jgi:hypothetical protein